MFANPLRSAYKTVALNLTASFLARRFQDQELQFPLALFNARLTAC